MRGKKREGAQKGSEVSKGGARGGGQERDGGKRRRVETRGAGKKEERVEGNGRRKLW